VSVPVRVQAEIVEESSGRSYSFTRFDAVKKAAYVRYVRQGIRRVRASELCGVTYSTVREHMHKDEDFARDVSEAEMARLDEVEEAMYQTAIQGNVVAQQVVLYNRRPDEWADQRMLRSRLEAAAAGAEASETRAAESAMDSLKAKLSELRERLVPADLETANDVVEAELEDDDEG
jgi:predicted transcriptional regulator